MKIQECRLGFSDSANAVVKLNALVSWKSIGMPQYAAKVKRQGFERRGSVWSWSLEQSLFLPGLACRSEAVCQFCRMCNDIAEKCDSSKCCRKQVPWLTLYFLSSQHSVLLLFQKGCCKLSRAVSHRTRCKACCLVQLFTCAHGLSFSFILAVLEANYSPLSFTVYTKILCVLVYLLKSFESALLIGELFLHQDVSIKPLQFIYRQSFGVAGQGKTCVVICSRFSFFQLDYRVWMDYGLFPFGLLA